MQIWSDQVTDAQPIGGVGREPERLWGSVFPSHGSMNRPLFTGGSKVAKMEPVKKATEQTVIRPLPGKRSLHR